jgi:hypothetical protein
VAKGKKQENPNKVAQRKAERVAFVQANPNLAPEVARQRFYVQTRAAELQAAGKDVDRAALREKFQSGGVTREGFYTPGDISRFNAARDNTSSLADSKSTPSATTPVVPSATNVPTPVKPVTSSVKTPSTSYQAPQTTTALGQVAQPSTSYMAPQSRTPNPVRGGEPGRTITPPALVRPSMPAGGSEPDRKVRATTQNGISVGPATTDPSEGREFSSLINRINPQPAANPQALNQQRGARLRKENEARINASNPLRAAAAKKVEEGYVAAPYDWTNMYKLTAGTLTLGAEIVGTRFGGPVGGALATGTAFNLTERLGNLLEQKGALGGMPGDPNRFEGKTDFKSAAIIGGASLGGNLLGTGVAKLAPKIKPAWRALQNWADDTPVQPITPWKEGGAASPGIATGVKPRTPWMEGPKTTGVVSPRRVADPKVTTPKVVEPQAAQAAPTFTPERVTESGLVIPATTTRRSPVLEKALDDVLGAKPAAQEPVSLGGAKEAAAREVEQANLQAEADRVIAGGEKTYEQMNRWEKGAYTKQQKKLALQAQNVEPKVDTVPPAKAEPVPNVTPTPAPRARNFEKETRQIIGDDNYDKINEAFGRTVAPEPAPVVKDDGVREINISFNDEPISSKPKFVQRAGESNEAYAKRLQVEQFKNSGAVTKVEAGFDLPRPTGRDKNILGIEAGMSRSNRLSFIDDMSGDARPKLTVVQGESADRLAMMRNHPAFTSKLPENQPNLAEVKELRPRMRDRFADINDAGEFDLTDAAGFPKSEPGETVMQFNERVRKFQEARGKTVPKSQGDYPQPEAPKQKPKSLEGNAEPKRPTKNSFGQRLYKKQNPQFDPETNEWYNTKVDPDTGETVFIKPRVKGQQLTPAEKSVKNRAKNKKPVVTKEIPVEAKGTFTIAGETIEGSTVVLPRGVNAKGVFVGEGIPPDSSLLRTTYEERVALSQANPTMNVDDYVSRELSPDEQQLFANLREQQGQRVGRRVAEPVKGVRSMKPGSELATYEQEYASILEDQGEINLVSFMRSPRQIELEKKIEKAFGTDALATLRKKWATVNESIPTSGITETAPASFSEVLPSQLRQELPLKPGANLRQQAAELFNAQGLLKGKTGPGRARLWQRVKESQWFMDLSAKEPTFAKFLVEKNDNLTEMYKGLSLSEGTGAPRGAMSIPRDKAASKLTEDQALAQIAREELRSVNMAANQGSFLEMQEARRGVSQLFPGEDDAFGRINQARIARETNVALTPEQEAVLKDFGVLDQTGKLQMNYADIAAARNELSGRMDVGSFETTNELLGVRKQAFYDEFGEAPKKDKANSKGWVKEQWLQKKDEYMSSLLDAPSTSGLPADPFASRIDPNLVDPNQPIRPEAAAAAEKWAKREARKAELAASRKAKQEQLSAEIKAAREAGLLKEAELDDFLTPRPSRKAEMPTLKQLEQRYMIEQQTRRESLARAAAKAKAQSFEVKPSNPLAGLGELNQSTGMYEQIWQSPSGSMFKTEVKVGPGDNKFRYVIEDYKSTPVSVAEANKGNFDAARLEAMKEEQANVAEILKDWMSGD